MTICSRFRGLAGRLRLGVGLRLRAKSTTMLELDRAATITVRLTIGFASIFIVGALAFTLPSLGGRLSLPLLPSGIAVAGAFRWGRRMWWAVFAAGMAI